MNNLSRALSPFTYVTAIMASSRFLSRSATLSAIDCLGRRPVEGWYKVVRAGVIGYWLKIWCWSKLSVVDAFAPPDILSRTCMAKAGSSSKRLQSAIQVSLDDFVELYELSDECMLLLSSSSFSPLSVRILDSFLFIGCLESSCST